MSHIELRVALDFVWSARSKLRAQGSKLWAEGNKLWAEAILLFCGNIKIQWQSRVNKSDYACELESGEVFEPD